MRPSTSVGGMGLSPFKPPRRISWACTVQCCCWRVPLKGRCEWPHSAAVRWQPQCVAAPQQ
eukprot:6329380-Pyramimonas_sp.AAC.2